MAEVGIHQKVHQWRRMSEESEQRIAQEFKKREEWPANVTKEFVQNAAESLMRNLVQARYSLILRVGAIAIIALASAGLWIGVAGVGFVLVLLWWRNGNLWQALPRLDAFRGDFLGLLSLAEEGKTEMSSEERELLREYKSAVLHPLVVTQGYDGSYCEREPLAHVETLVQEHFPFPTHDHPPESCKLCMGARRMREYILAHRLSGQGAGRTQVFWLGHGDGGKGNRECIKGSLLRSAQVKEKSRRSRRERVRIKGFPLVHGFLD
ncbi:MAG TPA: hypothetical protein VKK81_08240 [Candidatus Binatia bacterium]|nr:hypothetical protein [Candidatus Binatia bacterium]